MKRMVTVIALILVVCLVLPLQDSAREATISETIPGELSHESIEKRPAGALSPFSDPGVGSSGLESVKLAAQTVLGMGQVAVFSAAVLIALNGKKRF